MAIAAITPNMTYSIWAKLASNPTKTKKNDLTKKVTWLCKELSMVSSGNLILRSREKYVFFPSINQNTRAVRAPDSPNEVARKNNKNIIPIVSM